MIDPSQLLFNPADPKVAAFAPSSRYCGLAVLTLEDADGTVHAYVARRIVPLPDDLAVSGEYVVSAGERADLIAFRTLGDAELFWRLCDGNRALDPRELEQPGRRLRVTLPEGFPGGRAE